jgi:N6-L-threonylcarbamoyladenine synthase
MVEAQGAEVKVQVLHSLNSEKTLARWGGVVPEIAAREHVRVLAGLIELTVQDAGISYKDIGEIAVTAQPGLIGALLTGLNAAKTLAWLHHKPITPVPHLWAHLEAIHLTEKVPYPYLGLLISGGHTLIVLVKNHETFEVLGQTLDDAAGEAFDKGGKLLGLGYPAGKIIDEKAQTGNPKAFEFPISYMRDRPGKMSFSGLKTALRVFHEKNPEANIHDVCASYQHAIIMTLKDKMKEVMKLHLLQELPIVVGGGVACNSYLRQEFTKSFRHSFFVAPKYCTDNAAMIAVWAALNPQALVAYPDCLSLDAKSKMIAKPPMRS